MVDQPGGKPLDLRRVVRESGVSQRALAAATGIAQARLCRWLAFAFDLSLQQELEIIAALPRLARLTEVRERAVDVARASEQLASLTRRLVIAIDSHRLERRDREEDCHESS